MTERLATEVADGCASGDPRRAERWERLRADIAHFVENGRVSWSFMQWLDPKKFEHWELRSVRPRPSLRVFGRFADVDVFIGTHVAERSALGAKWSLNWEMEKLTCEDEWNKATSGAEPFRCAAYAGYFTENACRFPRVPG